MYALWITKYGRIWIHRCLKEIINTGKQQKQTIIERISVMGPLI